MPTITSWFNKFKIDIDFMDEGGVTQPLTHTYGHIRINIWLYAKSLGLW